MIERAVGDRRNGNVDNLVFVRGDALELPFRKQSFDAVCCFAALHLFADPFAALDSMTRVLAPGGRIAIFTTCHGHSAPIRTFESMLSGQSGMYMFERDEIVIALEARGFTDIRQLVAGFTQFVGGELAA
jgi:ubiquinone/menaquinone biosynthesis C-methylase UbiE